MKPDNSLFETQQDTTSLTDGAYLRLPQVLRLIPVSKSTFYLGIKTGRFPKSIKISERISVWHVDDIRRCIEAYRNKAVI